MRTENVRRGCSLDSIQLQYISTPPPSATFPNSSCSTYSSATSSFLVYTDASPSCLRGLASGFRGRRGVLGRGGLSPGGEGALAGVVPGLGLRSNANAYETPARARTDTESEAARGRMRAGTGSGWGVDGEGGGEGQTLT